MLIVKDTMVLIHLEKLSILRASCQHFGEISIPPLVCQEVLVGKEKGAADAVIVEELINEDRIQVKKITNANLIRKACQFNIQGGEAEAVALYWQEKADFIATDDDNVRKKKMILDLHIIGTPAILMKLHKSKIIEKEKMMQCIDELKRIGWFSTVVIDTLRWEALNG